MHGVSHSIFDLEFPDDSDLDSTASRSVPDTPTLHLPRWHYLGNTAVYVPMHGIAQPGIVEVMYWFGKGTYLPERARWAAFVRQHAASCYRIDLPTAAAARDLHGCHYWFVLRYDAEVHQFLAGYTGRAPTPSPVHVRSWWRSVSTCKAVT